jgi:hypothetical protein
MQKRVVKRGTDTKDIPKLLTKGASAEAEAIIDELLMVKGPKIIPRFALWRCFFPKSFQFQMRSTHDRFLDAPSSIGFNTSVLNEHSIPIMPTKLISTATCSLAVLLSLWLLVSNWSNQSLQRALQTQQDEIQAHQVTIQGLQQQLQAQQQLIDAASQLANQVGPAVIRDLATLQIQNKNQKIAALLKKYGIEAKSN